MSRGVYGEEELLQFLDKEMEKGGLGLDRRVAERLAGKIKIIIGEIKELQKEENPLYEKDYGSAKEAVQIGGYLSILFELKNLDASLIERMENGIRNRLENHIDKKGFYKVLDLSVKKGGVGLDRRRAKKIAQHLELLLLGKLK